MPSPEEVQDRSVRAAVYEVAMATGRLPAAGELAERLGVAATEALASLERLAAAKGLVLQRDSREILMANPFSAVPTPFAVHAENRLYYGNCIWDALGIPAMLGVDAHIYCSCGCCGEAAQLSILNGRLVSGEGLAHFAVPAHRWWQDIVYN